MVHWEGKEHQGGTNNGALKCHAALGSGRGLWGGRGKGRKGGGTWEVIEEGFRGGGGGAWVEV